jgi:RHS repeat-associated protein
MSKAEQNSPPAGSGYLRGLGEAFNIDLNTGQGTYSYQIPLPEGIARHTPKLVLEYAHGVGHSIWGFGWRLGLRTISRRLDVGTPDYNISERFLDNGSEIIAIGDGLFGALRETVFSRYSQVGNGWQIEERNGQIHELGASDQARVADPHHPDHIVEWLVERSTDTLGNTIRYSYLIDQNVAYPSSIRYADYEVRFTYESRPDSRYDGRSGFLRRRALRCSHLQIVLDPGPSERVIRTYFFIYTISPRNAVSLLNDIRHVANGPAGDGSDDVSRPTIHFDYSDFNPRDFHISLMKSKGGPPPGLDDEDTALVTLDNAPLPGILINRNGSQYYWANRGDGFWEPAKPLRRAPLVSSFSRAGLSFVDMDGSGTADLMVANPDNLQGYYENKGNDGWGNFVAFPRGSRGVPSWSDSNLRLTDVNQDGLIDALVSYKRAFVWWRNNSRQGWSFPTLALKSSEGLNEIDLSDPDVYLADMSGDGLSDIVRLTSGRVEYWPNLGCGRFADKVVMQNSPRLQRDFKRDTIMLVDLDGDGCTDLVQVSSQGLLVYQNQNGLSFAEPVSIRSIPSPIPGTVRAVNINGRAGTGLVWNSLGRDHTSYVQFEFAGQQPPYLLTRIENGSGLVSEIFYRSAVEDYERDRDQNSSWTTNFPFPYLVVGMTRETDTVSLRTSVVDYLYREAHFETHSRQFQGFRVAERIERGDQSRPDTRIVHHFLMAQEHLPGHSNEYALLNGMLNRIETYQLDSSPVQHLPYYIETSEYDLVVLNTTSEGSKRCFVFVNSYKKDETERTGDVRTEEKFYTYDSVGNVIHERYRGSGTRGGIVLPEREQNTEINYTSSSTKYLLDKPARILIRDQNGNLLSEKRFYYDGPEFIGLSLGQVDRGLLTKEEEWILTQAEFDDHYAGMSQTSLGYSLETNADGIASVFSSQRRYRYDSRGLVIASLDPLGTESMYGYDDGGLFRIRLTDALGETRFDYDRRTGQIIQITYADGTVTRFVYDAQGRVLKSALPGEDLANAATVYSYDETSIPNRRIATFNQSHGVASKAITYFDGFGKEFQQRVEVTSGQFLVSGLKLPNPWGELREEYEPVFSTSSDFAFPDTSGNPVRRFFYDACGRVVRSENFDAGISTADYEPFRVVLHDANDNDDSEDNKSRGQFNTPCEEEFDVFHNLIRVTQYIGNGQQIVMNYEVGPRGELATVADGRGIKFRYGYDRIGNRLRIVLRESGERKIWYDARKIPIRTLDPAGHDLRAEWDALGRQTRLFMGNTVLEEYHYDIPAQHALGRLAEVRYPGGRQQFTYSITGRLIKRNYFYDSESNSYGLNYEYDNLGRETAVIHTDGTRIDRQLTFNGWLQAISGIIHNIEYDPRGFPSVIRYENGVNTEFDYTPGPGRIRVQKTTSPNDGLLEHVEFKFDKMQTLISSNDTAPGGVGLRDFTYDPLYQLVNFSNVENGNTVRRAYDYAGDYNLRRFDEAGSTLHYDDLTRPDRLTGLTIDGGTLFTINYDGNGNVLTLPGQQFEFNPKNELIRFIRDDGLAAEYQYDHLGVRTSKTLTEADGSHTRILYISDQAEIRNGEPSYFVLVGKTRVAVYTNGTIQFLHGDGLGSTKFVTDPSGKRIATMDYFPFGNTAKNSGDVKFRSFSLSSEDPESGLCYMHRRYYAPRLGRFLTPDLMAICQPEKFLHTPQGLHLYAFVRQDRSNWNVILELPWRSHRSHNRRRCWSSYSRCCGSHRRVSWDSPRNRTCSGCRISSYWSFLFCC